MHGSNDILSMIKTFKCNSLMYGKHRCVKFALNIFRETNPENILCDKLLLLLLYPKGSRLVIKW